MAPVKNKPMTPAQIKQLVAVFVADNQTIRAMPNSTMRVLIRQGLVEFAPYRQPVRGDLFLTLEGRKLVEPLWAEQEIRKRRLERAERRYNAARARFHRAHTRFEKVVGRAAEHPERVPIERINSHLEVLRLRWRESEAADTAYEQAKQRTRGPTHGEIMAFLIARKLNAEENGG